MSDRTWVGEPAKPTPVSLDRLLILDSADSDNNKLITLGSLPGTEFFGPWTGNHDAGEFSLFNLGLLVLKIDNTTAVMELDANHTTPTAGQIIGQIDWFDDDSVGVRQAYSRIRSLIFDPTNGSESGELIFTAFQGGVPIDYITLNDLGGDDITFGRDVDFNGFDTSNINFLGVSSSSADTVALATLADTSTNAGTFDIHVGDRDPNANITAAGMAQYYRDEGELSASYTNTELTTGTRWMRNSYYPPEQFEFTNSAQFDEFASGGIITITSSQSWRIRGAITTANRIVINSGVSLHISAEHGSTNSITYTGGGTFFSGEGAIRIWATLFLFGNSTGTLLGMTGTGTVNLRDSAFIDWASLGGTTGGGQFFGIDSFFLNIGEGFTLTNVPLANVTDFAQEGSALNGAFFTINTNDPTSILNFTDISGTALGTGELFDIRGETDNAVSISVRNSKTVIGDLFRESLSSQTINSVADDSPVTGSITAQADNGSGGTTHSNTTVYFDTEEVTISGTAAYDGFFKIFNVVPGVSFDTISGFATNEATGSTDSVRLNMTLAGLPGVSPGDTVKITNTNFYNGFVTVLNIVTNDLIVNGTFISTNTGIVERNRGLDHSDPRVFALGNARFLDSHFIAGAHVNNNATVNGTIVNNTFTDMVFGTVGAALISASNMERWRLLDELNGTFEYFGNEPFDGSISFDFTVESAGGTVDFRFKWEISTDGGAVFVDLADPVEALIAVGADAVSATKTFPLTATPGSQIRPQITRNTGASGITTTYATVYTSSD